MAGGTDVEGADAEARLKISSVLNGLPEACESNEVKRERPIDMGIPAIYLIALEKSSETIVPRILLADFQVH